MTRFLRNIMLLSTLIFSGQLLYGCGVSLTKVVAEPRPSTGPSEGMARVYFIHPATAMGQAYILWEDKLIGSLKGKQYFFIDVPAGQQLFVSVCQNTEYLDANLAAGKTYTVKVFDVPGVWGHARCYLTPLHPDPGASAERKAWFEKSVCVELNQEAALKWDEEYGPRNKNRVEAFRAGKVEPQYLVPEDGE